MTSLTAAVRAFSDALVHVPDSTLTEPWSGVPGKGDWSEYSDNLGEIVFLIYQKLRELAGDIQNERMHRGFAPTRAQRILGQHRLAYRDLIGVLAGVHDDELDLAPLEAEWSIRGVIAHTSMAEWWAYRPHIRHALQLYRAGLPPTELTANETVGENGEPIDTFGPLPELIKRYEHFHTTVTREFASVTDAELRAPSAWWEREPVQVGFRLYRFDWHIRDHTVQIEKILEAIGHQRTETQLRARALYGALGEVEASLIGANRILIGRQRALAEAIIQRAEEIRLPQPA
jgi:hypothetical protein